ncbi:MAG: hypothetical protein OXF41_06480 [bacterium]|nr:hypothetical protein [bacterium]
MTAEVAILNREAVVMAADSALTLGGQVGKVYNSANKLFALSRLEPVAVMVYGGGSFEGIPWATVVKEHRRHLSLQTFDTVEQYAAEFIEYLSSLIHHMPVEFLQARVRMRASWELDRLRKAVDRTLADEHGDGEQVVGQVLMDQIESRLQRLEELDTGDGPGESVAARELDEAIDDWDTLVKRSLKGLPVTDRVRTNVRAMVCASLGNAVWGPASSGVVVAGFGRAQMFPALSLYLVDGVHAGRVRARQLEEIQIGWEDSAAICPFAQQDMVQTFMDGLHPDYPRALGEFVDETIKLFAAHFGDRVKDAVSSDDYAALIDTMDRARLDIVEHFHSQLRDLLETQHSDPVMAVVDMLPKEELAEMAEALVNLTSLKRRVTPDDETVGGPVDVAVISKGDGLVWIKRKHYFAPEMNPRYFEQDRGLRTSDRVGGRNEQNVRGSDPPREDQKKPSSGPYGVRPG